MSLADACRFLVELEANGFTVEPGKNGKLLVSPGGGPPTRARPGAAGASGRGDAMGTKMVTTTTERTVHVCDRCARQIDSRQNCFVCRREVGYCCSTLVRGCYNEPGHYDLTFQVCKDCDEAGRDVCGTPFVERIRDKAQECDLYVADQFERWKAWAEERRERKGDA